VGIAVCLLGVAAPDMRQLIRDARPRTSSNVQQPVNAAEAAREAPGVVRPLTKPCLRLSAADIGWLERQIQPGPLQKMSPSYVLHVLRAHGLNADFPKPSMLSTSAELLGIVTDDRREAQVFGKSSAVLVTNGARYIARTPVATERWREQHRDQHLAAFAELGLPLSTPLSFDGKTVPLREVLRDSIANFHLKQREIEWTALAYTLLLPPTTQWFNRFGERYTFDSLSDELLARDFRSSSCAGTHLLYGLTFIARADEEVPLLSKAVRHRVRERIDRAARLAVERQRPDGAWDGEWFVGPELGQKYWPPSLPPTLEQRVIVTGHVAEWMLYLPAEFQVDRGPLQRASWWLFGELKRLGSEGQAQQFCACTHAVCVLRRLALPIGSSNLGLNASR